MMHIANSTKPAEPDLAFECPRDLATGKYLQYGVAGGRNHWYWFDQVAQCVQYSRRARDAHDRKRVVRESTTGTHRVVYAVFVLESIREVV
jgi:hypothetical protein